MLRKLKPLHEVLAMYPEYKITPNDYALFVLPQGASDICEEMLTDFGKTIDIGDNLMRSINANSFSYDEAWFEPEEKWFEVVYRRHKDNPFKCEQLFKCKDDFLMEYEHDESEFEWIELVELKRGE